MIQKIQKYHLHKIVAESQRVCYETALKPNPRCALKLDVNSNELIVYLMIYSTFLQEHDTKNSEEENWWKIIPELLWKRTKTALKPQWP